MKTLKMNFIKILASFSLVILLLTNGYTQSKSDTKTVSENKSDAKLMVEQPKMDIHAAIISGNLEMVKQHIEAGIDINAKDPMGGSTPLITAATFVKTDIAKALIDANAELDIQNNEGSTALHAAAFFCHVEIVKMLVEAGADKSVKNNHNATPLQSVIVPFSEMKPVYEMIQKQLEPLGLKLDLKEVEITRPMIAILLQ